MLTGWAEGWTGAAAQLECGDYETFRFHLRLFPAGDWTLANAHYEILIPGTTDHQVLSWNLGRDFVLLELFRTGLAGLGGAPVSLTESPSFKTVLRPIYDALGPLQALVGPTPDDPSANVGIPSDGLAMIVQMTGRADPVPGTASQDFTIAFDQIVPKPFCASPGSFLKVTGPVRLQQHVVTRSDGEVSSRIQATGKLTVAPVVGFGPDGAILGDPVTAQVTDHYAAATLGRGAEISSNSLRVIAASGGGQSESARKQWRVDEDGRTWLSAGERCAD